MSITPFLPNQAFDPETLQAMTDAYENVCRELGLAERNDPLNEMIAKHVIKLAQWGIHTTTALYMLTMKEFKANPR